MVPFTVEQFFEVFRQYNTAVWPMQIILALAALIALVLILSKRYMKGAPVILGLLWLWTGIVYHIIFFSTINGTAYLFGALFIIEGALFLVLGLKDRLQFEFKPDAYRVTGLILIIFSLAIYPLLNYAFDHRFPSNPTFGLPCPVVIFTFGLLLMSKRIPKYLLAIPLLWSFIGMSAAVNLGVWEDMGLVVAGVLGTTMLVYRDWRKALKKGASSTQ